MSVLSCFINLFFVPLVGMGIYCKRHKIEMKASLKVFVVYGIITACNIPMAHVFVFLIRLLSEHNVTADNASYAVCALLGAVLIPYIAEFYEKYIRLRVDIEVQGEE